jgi:hypothetical protein
VFLQTTIAVFVRFWNRDSPYRSRFYWSSLHVSLIINTKVVFVSLFIRFGLQVNLVTRWKKTWTWKLQGKKTIYIYIYYQRSYLHLLLWLHYLLNETERCWYIALAQPCSTRRPWFSRPRPSPISAFKEKDSPKLVPRQGSDF